MTECTASGEPARNKAGSRYSSLKKDELEALAVSAILEHRRLLDADEAVYEEWLRASGDPLVSSDVAQTLQDEYLARQKQAQGQQEELSEILDALGYVPVVPSGEKD
ncbi:transcriptional repressor TraM [Rhizobium grahamii]|uniref:Transcriptional repressor, traM n=1 Tax=Rhizobium grahamii CCGE 502 TaxID=990285 RepID=S3I259_9HYPH|nr:transcriptional repressor TraM [Rhizobium grahamii]EPE93873.1 transcriptional repressor, traM [Rhizobium grahamii CCGE 502]